jgi:transposase
VNSESLQAENAALRQQVAQKDREIALLRQKLDALARRLFGKKSEQLSAAQLELLLSGLAEGALPEGQEEEEPPARQLPPRSPARPQRLRTPDNLEVVREVVEPELVAQEPEKWKQISQEISRRLDYQPGKFFWHETIRPKYVRIDNRQLPPVVAPAPVFNRRSHAGRPGISRPVAGQQIW